MDKQDQNYGLRPRRSATKGKYREMLGISQQPSNEDDIHVKSNENAPQSPCKIIFLPILVSETSDVLTDNAIEIEISDDVNVAELSEMTIVTGEDLNPLSLSENPSKHIDEILHKNDKLIESIAEGPSFKRRRRVVKDAKPGSDYNPDDEEPSCMELLPKEKKQQRKNENVMLTLKGIPEMINRCLNAEEEEKIDDLLNEGKPEIVVNLLFGEEAENRIRKCLTCDSLVEGSDSSYASHYEEVHQSEPIFVCELCAEFSNSSSMYQSHLQSHFKGKTQSRKSNEDKRDEDEESDSGKANNGEPYVCDICGKTLKHQKSLYSHRRTHTDAKAVCHICGATLKSSRYLHHHLLLHKDVEKPHKCDKCGKAFFSSSALKVHHYYNHEEHPGRFQCTICSKTFKAKQGLQFHMDSHSSELRYECSYCHKRFRGFKTCRVHEMRHRESNEPNKFSCSICGKLFKTRQTLKNHEDVHASFNRYQCSLCEKRFKLRKSCLAHIRVHHTDNDRAETQQSIIPDEGEIAVESLLAEGEEYVVTLEEGEVEHMDEDGEEQETVELIVPEAHVECEVANVS